MSPALLFLLAAAPAPAAVAAPFEDFREAAAWVAGTRGGVVRDRVAPHFLGDGPAFWYRVGTGPGTAEFVLVDPDRGTRRPAIDAAAVAAALAAATGGPVAADRLPVRALEFPDGPSGPVRFVAAGRAWETTAAGTADRGPVGESESFGVERLAAVRPSIPGGAETGVTFVNDTAGPVRLVWAGDRRVGYGTIPAGGRKSQHTFAEHVWLVEDADGVPLAAFAATEDAGVARVDGRGPGPRFRDPETPADPAPTGGSPISVRGGDVFFEPPGGGGTIRLTDAAAEPVPDGFERVEYRGPVRVSPDGAAAAVVRAVVAPVRDLVLSDPGPPGTGRPTIVRVPYPKPGDPTDRPAPVFFATADGARTDVPADPFPAPFALTRFRWSADGGELRFLHNPRGHRFLQVLAADRATGAVRVVIDERSDTFVDYSRKTALHDPGDGTLLWASERSGWNHLYRVDAATGAVRNAVTAGEWVVRGVEKVEGGRVWFRAGGVVPGQDPYHVHLCRAGLNGGGFVVLTSDDAEPGDGTHDWTFTPDGRFLIDRFGRVDLPPVTVLRDAETGALVTELERADATAKRAAGWRPPVRFSAPGRDGETPIYGTVQFPPGFDAATAGPGSLPVIEKIYAGPHGAHVRKAWGDERDVRELAALGFAVVRCDGMGTNWRSKVFHDVAWRDLADAGFPDRIAFIRAAAEAFPALDLGRVGIYGGSAGGQNALRALLSHGDFYAAAAADCGCHDNRVDKRWWNEAWLGEVGPHYDAGSNARDAGRLTGDLLLTVGGLDRNVDPAGTMQVVDALLEAGKEFELIVFPRGGHGIGESDEGRRRRANFFRRALAAD